MTKGRRGRKERRKERTKGCRREQYVGGKDGREQGKEEKANIRRNEMGEKQEVRI